MARVKAMPGGAGGAAAAAEAENYRPELVTDEEPRYLRRQKPLEIRRKKFGGRNWPLYRRVAGYGMLGVVGIAIAWVAIDFFLHSPKMLLLNPEQIELSGNRIVSRESVLQTFLSDRSHSVVSVPLDARRSEIEQLPWVESATVERILPNHLRVELTERTPIAFLRIGNELALVDAQGVILDRPEGEDLHFPIVTGISEDLPREQREKRMQIYQEFIKDIDLVRPASSDRVSEIELANPKDLRVVMTGLGSSNSVPGIPDDASKQAVTVHFGSGEFVAKYRMLVENFAQWQANAGRVRSIDLQYARQVVINPDASGAVSMARAK
ncbi:MAG: FtsQ-type POTRA domain-containing protein [Candidatus Acidiferrum sp.]|jgi:cell division protein FtsQ